MPAAAANPTNRKPSSPEAVDPLAALSFEDAAAELEQLVEEMENNVLPLEQMLASYERGVRLAQHCTLRLSDAEKRIEIIRRLPDGQVSTQPLDVEGNAAEAETAAPRARTAPAPVPANPSASASAPVDDADDDELALF